MKKIDICRNSFSIISLSLVLIVFLFVGIISNHKQNTELAINKLKIENSEYKSKISMLNSTVEELEKELEESEIYEKKIKEIESHIDLNDDESLKKAKEISENTSLDFITSCIIIKYSNKFDLKPSLILSVIDLESNFKQYEVGSSEDRGYMQIIPGTEKWLAKEFGETLGLEYNPENIFNPNYNIGLGSAYLSLLQKEYGSDYNRILSEYNRGPYNLKKYYEENKTYVTSYSKVVLSKEKKYLAYNK